MSLGENNLLKNLSLYPLYQAASGFLPWLPVFFLFFFQHMALAQALTLSAVYYLSVFILEVPSGYFSDKYGRRLTLILASGFAIVAYLMFILASSFTVFAVAQFLLAGFFSFKSGSDNSLLYDTLQALEREAEYAEREANATRYSMLALAAAAFAGGVTGLLSLTIPYVLSLAGALATLYFCSQFTEPPRAQSAAPFMQQLGVCIGSLKNPVLLWLFVFFVLAYSLQHVPAEFNQPYVKLLQQDWFSSNDLSALLSGSMVAISMLGGAWGASISIRLLQRLGTGKLLLAGLAVMVLIITAMAAVLHPLVLLFVLLRNFPMAFSEAPMLAAIAPHIGSSYRATYLSLQSLAGRAGFAFLLLSAAKMVDSGAETALNWSQLQCVLMICLILAIGGFAALVVFRKSSIAVQ